MKIDTKSWKPFRIRKYFDIHPTKAYPNLSKDELDDGGSVPLVVNSSENNGIGGYSSLDATEKGGIITFSDTTEGNTFFISPTILSALRMCRECIPLAGPGQEMNCFSW